MDFARVRSGWVGGFALLVGSAFLSSCSAVSSFTSPAPAPVAQSAGVLPSDDDDYSQLIAQLRADLNRYNSREIAPKPTIAPQAQSAKARDREFAQRAQALFSPLSSLRMPVVGVRPHDLSDSWHDPRSGGRVHKGIDIFAARGTEVVAVADGIISYIGDQRLGGHCVWLTTENGASFYYAHLDRWAAGLYEGMEVQSGDLIGYVGNTGNAAHTPSHLHFAVNESDEMVNPFPLLKRAIPVQQARVHVTLSGGVGTR
jgi:murein DD-endopeptidase MepM/ murein hydrolase activator NlpD